MASRCVIVGGGWAPTLWEMATLVQRRAETVLARRSRLTVSSRKTRPPLQPWNTAATDWPRPARHQPRRLRPRLTDCSGSASKQPTPHEPSALHRPGGAEFPWIYPPASALAQHGPVVAIQPGARRRPWPFDEQPARLRRVTWGYPPGFNGRLASLFTPMVRRRVDGLRRRLANAHDADPMVITPGPRFGPYAASVSPSRLVYRNYDDFATYDAEGQPTEHPDEDELIPRAGLVACASYY